CAVRMSSRRTITAWRIESLSARIRLNEIEWVVQRVRLATRYPGPSHDYGSSRVGPQSLPLSLPHRDSP
ncbi:unnamed protein product, partial [Mycena citricolor]